MAEDIARLTGRPHALKVFRIHRDVRFSKDKTPYNPHLRLLWSRKGKDAAPAWFFGSAPDYLILGMGAPTLEKDPLTRWRAAVDRDGDAIAAALADAAAAAGATISDWGPEPLKNVPKPCDQSHPHAALLRRKGLTVSAPLPEGWRDTGRVFAVAARVEQLLPLWRKLDAALAS